MKKLLFGNWVARLAWLMMLTWPMVGLTCFDDPGTPFTWDTDVKTDFIELDSTMKVALLGERYYKHDDISDTNKISITYARRLFIVFRNRVNNYEDYKILVDSITTLGKRSYTKIGFSNDGYYLITNSNNGGVYSKTQLDSVSSNFQVMFLNVNGGIKKIQLKSMVGTLKHEEDPDSTSFGNPKCIRDTLGGFIVVSEIYGIKKMRRYYFDLVHAQITEIPQKICPQGGLIVDQIVDGVDTMRICQDKTKNFFFYNKNNVIHLDENYKKCFFDAFLYKKTDSILNKMRVY